MNLGSWRRAHPRGDQKTHDEREGEKGRRNDNRRGDATPTLSPEEDLSALGPVVARADGEAMHGVLHCLHAAHAACRGREEEHHVQQLQGMGRVHPGEQRVAAGTHCIIVACG